MSCDVWRVSESIDKGLARRTISSYLHGGRVADKSTNQPGRFAFSAPPVPTRFAQHGDDSVWPNLYCSITAPTPTRSSALCETSSTRTTLACPLMNACAASDGGMIENQIFIPALSLWLILK